MGVIGKSRGGGSCIREMAGRDWFIEIVVLRRIVEQTKRLVRGKSLGVGKD